MKNILPKNKREWLRFAKNTGFIFLGTFILAFGITMFIFPFNLVTGGISGLGIILSKAFAGVPLLAGIGPDVYSSVINWILFAIGFIVLGKDFAMKTLVSTIVYPFALFVCELLVKESSLSYLLDLSTYPQEYYTVALIVATIFGGACIGMGCAFTFLGGGSTGGVDVIALTLSKYVKSIKSSVAFFVCDAIIIVIGMFAIENILLSLLGIVSALICAISIDKLFLGESRAFIAHVVSDKYVEINRAVINRMERTTTIVDAIGGFSGEDKKMVIITFDMHQYPLFTQIISEIDKSAFVTVHKAHEINGEGWTYGLDKNAKKI